MKNLEIVGIVNAYMASKEQPDGMKLPAAVAWKRRVNLNRLSNAKTLIDEALRELQTQYMDDDHSDPAEDGGRKVKPEFLPEFFREQSEILSQDTPVDISKINIEDLGDIALTDADMDTLAFMINGGE